MRSCWLVDTVKARRILSSDAESAFKLCKRLLMNFQAACFALQVLERPSKMFLGSNTACGLPSALQAQVWAKLPWRAGTEAKRLEMAADGAAGVATAAPVLQQDRRGQRKMLCRLVRLPMTHPNVNNGSSEAVHSLPLSWLTALPAWPPSPFSTDSVVELCPGSLSSLRLVGSNRHARIYNPALAALAS